MQPEDILGLRSAGDAQPSPDGRQVAFVVTELDAAADLSRSSIWIVPADGGASRCLTQGSEPRWSPDGRRLAFVSDRGGGAQIWLLRLDGGDAACLTHVTGGVSGPPVWSPDGARVAFTARVSAGGQASTRAPRVIRKLRYLLNGAGFIGDSYWHVFTVTVEGGSQVQLTSGEWHHFAPTWSADGTRIACITTRRDEWDTEWVWDLFVLPDGAAPRRLTESLGTCAAPAWSPDGKWIAYFDNRCPGTAYAKDYELWLIPAEGGMPRNLSGALDRGCQISQPPAFNEPARWSADSSAVYFHVREGGFFQYYAYNLNTDELQPVVASRDVEQPVAGYVRQSSNAECFSVAAPTATRPAEVYARSPGDAEWRRLTDLNPEPSFAACVPRRMVQMSPEGWEVESWLWLPPSYTEGDSPLPGVLYYHGGPHNTVALGVNEQLQLLAAAGFAVVGVNFRGSTGFGAAFADCILHDWGPRELADGLAIVDALVDSGVIDPTRVGVYGGSYGGFMTNLALARCDRFAAGVSTATISGLDSFSYVTDHWESVDWDSGGPPWSNAEYYRTHSPITYVDDIRVPLLIMHGEEDYRCSVAEADQLFGALRKMKRTVELVRYPGASHGFSHVGPPSYRVDAARRLVDWFRRYL